MHGLWKKTEGYTVRKNSGETPAAPPPKKEKEKDSTNKRKAPVFADPPKKEIK